MATVLNLLIRIGPLALLLGLIVALAVAVYGCIRRRRDKARWLATYLLGMIATAAAALFVGSGLGIAVFCSSESMGNLCGLGGVFGSGPLLAGIALAIYAQRRVSGRNEAF